MSKVSINTSQTTAVKSALERSLVAANMAATKMATGDAIIHAYEDPVGLAIGLKMTSDVNVLGIVSNGINQSKSMLYMIEAGEKAIYDTLDQMKGTLARAKLGYMTDELVRKTLSPTYVQLKQEINRIANSINFNGQTLLNGQSGVKNAGTKSTVSTDPTGYRVNGNSAITLAAFEASDIKVNAGIVNGGTTGQITFKPATAAVPPTVSGGTITIADNGDVIVSGAQLSFSGITAEDATSGAAKSAIGNLIVDNVTLTFKAGEFQYANGTIESESSKAPTVSGLTYADLSFTPTSIGELTAISDFSAFDANTINVIVTDGPASRITNLTAEYTITGGVAAGSDFSFVTGSDLSRDVVTFNFPNLALTTSNDVLGMIETLNTTDYVSNTRPTDLTDLRSISDADIDIPLIQALLDDMIIRLDETGAFQKRLNNVDSQLTTGITEKYAATRVVEDADLTQESENFVRANVQTAIAISTIKQLNNNLQSLQQLVTG